MKYKAPEKPPPKPKWFATPVAKQVVTAPAVPVVAEPEPVAVVPPPVSPLEARLVALELLVALHGTRLAILQEIPTAHDARLTALEVLVRAQASDVVSRATAMAALVTPRKEK